MKTKNRHPINWITDTLRGLFKDWKRKQYPESPLYIAWHQTAQERSKRWQQEDPEGSRRTENY